MPIEPNIAARLAQAAQRVDDSREERDRLICEAHAAGGSLREIKNATGQRISHVGVKRIVDRHKT